VSTPTQQALNVQQAIADLIYEQWKLTGVLSPDSITFKGFEEMPNSHFKEGMMMAIEVNAVSGTSIPQSLKHTKMMDLYKIDIFLKVPDTTAPMREEAENQRMQIIDRIWAIIHDNQVEISGLNIATLTRWLKKDELGNSPIILSNSLFITGQWYHKSSL
jgi:hypothetical protein